MAVAAATALRTVARAASPRHRRYRRLLESCDLDPHALERPIAEPGPHDVIICGCPRSGTALLSAALHQPPEMVTVMEPWDGLRLPPAELFGSLRAEMAGGSLRRGRLDHDALTADGTTRWGPEGTPTALPGVDDTTIVAVKWPTFWQYLPLLPSTRFIVCVRHPADVVASFAAQPGRLHLGLEYDVAFNRTLNAELEAIASVEDRRLELYDRVNWMVLDHAHRPEVLLVHYERWFDDPTALLADISSFVGRDVMASRAVVDPTRRPPPSTARDAVAHRSSTARSLGYLS